MKDQIRPPVRVDRDERVIAPDNRSTKVWRWRLNVPGSIAGTKKLRLYFKTEKDALAHAESLLAARRAAGDMIAKLRERKMTVTDAISYALRHAPIAEPVPIKEAIKRFVASREAANCKPRYIANLKSQLSQVREEMGSAMIDTITRAWLERFVASLTAKDGDTPANPKTKINFIITLSALFNFAVEEGWRGENPAAGLRRPRLDEYKASILSPDEVHRILSEGQQPEYADVFPAVLVQLFAGPRRSEIPHIGWELFKDSYLRLDKTKVRFSRPIELSSTLLDWLAPLRKDGARLFAPSGIEFDPRDTRSIEDAYTYRLGTLAERAGVEMSKNVLRHTAITYRVAATGNLGETALWAGNSPEVIRRHYLGAATKADAESFYRLLPERPPNSPDRPAALDGPDQLTRSRALVS